MLTAGAGGALSALRPGTNNRNEGEQERTMLAASALTARETLYYAAGLIETGLAPEGRAGADAKTFRELGDSAGDLPLTPADLVAGLDLIGAPSHVSEAPPIAARRKTCFEIAELLRPVADGDPQRLAAVFRAIESHFGRSTDDRQKAIAATAGREAAEIEDLAG